MGRVRLEGGVVVAARDRRSRALLMGDAFILLATRNVVRRMRRMHSGKMFMVMLLESSTGAPFSFLSCQHATRLLHTNENRLPNEGLWEWFEPSLPTCKLQMWQERTTGLLDSVIMRV